MLPLDSLKPFMICVLYILSTYESLISSIENVSKVFVNFAQVSTKINVEKRETLKYEVTVRTMSSMTTTK